MRLSEWFVYEKFQSWGKDGGLNRLLCFCFVGLISLSLNFPLARFPGQDLLWNDLMVLGRVAWAKAALLSNPFSSVDFLQGLGSPVMSDVKVVPHFFDPGVLFAFFVGDSLGLSFRSFILVVYCLYCLNRLIDQSEVVLPSGAPIQFGFRVPLLLYYVFSPIFFGDVAHHFSAIFYSIPGFILALRYFARSPSAKSSLALTGAMTLLIALSDVHIVFICGALGVFLVLFDRNLRGYGKGRLGVAIFACGACVFLSYARYLGFFQERTEMLLSQGSGWILPFYNEFFLKDALTSIIFPMFAGPVSVYILPYIPVMVIVFLLAPQKPQLALRLFLFIAGAGGLFLFGVVCHGFEPLRAKLPSAMRYHIAILPFLANLWIVFHLKDLHELFSHAHLNKMYGVWVVFAVAVFFREINLWLFAPKSDGFLAWVLLGGDYSLTFVRSLVRHCLLLFPMMFTMGVLLVRPLNGFLLKKTLMFSLLISIPVCFVPIITYGFPVPTFVDFGLSQTLYKRLPQAIIDSIGSSRVSSFVPIARGVVSDDRGRNDKLLPIIEYPDPLGGRSFFHWRYSYARQTSILYSEVTRQGPINFFPPVPKLLNEVIQFCETTLSPYIVSADSEIQDDRLLLKGKFHIGSEFLRKHPGGQTGVTGDVYIYEVKGALEKIQTTFKEIFYSRTKAVFHIQEGIMGPLRLPITYFPELRVCDENGNKVIKKRGIDGFLVVEPTLSQRKMVVSSFSLTSILSLLAPLSCFGLLWKGVQILNLGRPNYTTYER